MSISQKITLDNEEYEFTQYPCRCSMDCNGAKLFRDKEEVGNIQTDEVKWFIKKLIDRVHELEKPSNG